MRSGLLTAVLLLLPLWGCAESAPPIPQPLTQAVLFDAVPGWPAAGDMAARSDWPATAAFVPDAGVVWYRERFVDVQGGGWYSSRPWNHVHRRVETVRTGVATR